MLGLAACQIYACMGLTHSHAQGHWALKLAKSISSRPDIILNLGMLGMNVNPTNLSMSYHLTFRYSKQELRFKIYFS